VTPDCSTHPGVEAVGAARFKVDQDAPTTPEWTPLCGPCLTGIEDTRRSHPGRIEVGMYQDADR